VVGMTARQSLYGFGMKGKAHSPDTSERMSEEIDAYRAEVLAEAADVAEMVGSGFLDNAHSGEGNGAMAIAAELRSRADVLTPAVPAAGQDDTSTAEPDPTPISARWDRLVIHPDPDSDDDTIVCCLADDGRPVALFLDDELREALGMLLVDPDGDDEPTAQPDGHEPDCTCDSDDNTHDPGCDTAARWAADTYAGTRGEPGDVTT